MAKIRLPAQNLRPGNFDEMAMSDNPEDRLGVSRYLDSQLDRTVDFADPENAAQVSGISEALGDVTPEMQLAAPSLGRGAQMDMTGPVGPMPPAMPSMRARTQLDTMRQPEPAADMHAAAQAMLDKARGQGEAELDQFVESAPLRRHIQMPALQISGHAEPDAEPDADSDDNSGPIYDENTATDQDISFLGLPSQIPGRIEHRGQGVAYYPQPNNPVYAPSMDRLNELLWSGEFDQELQDPNALSPIPQPEENPVEDLGTLQAGKIYSSPEWLEATGLPDPRASRQSEKLPSLSLADILRMRR